MINTQTGKKYTHTDTNTHDKHTDRQKIQYTHTHTHTHTHTQRQTETEASNRQTDSQQHPPARLDSMSGLRPMRSTSHTPTKVKKKLMPAVMAANQMAVCWLLMPAILMMEAL